MWTRIERSTPIETEEDLLEIYGTSDLSSIPFFQKVKETQLTLEEAFTSKYDTCGVVMSIEGTWGSGKTSFINLALKDLETMNAVIIKYDSLFYGDVSEATTIFLDNIFKQIKIRYGVNLKASSLAQNISPRFELSNGIPKLNIDFSRDGQKRATELIKEELAKKLKKLDGKVIVVIDDLDRVSGADLVHFLRLVRVLKELPNFIIIMPIDRKALEDLLSTAGVSKPDKYMEKIIDWRKSVDPELDTSKMIFQKKIVDKSGELLDSSSLDELWKIVLLELALSVYDREDIRSMQGGSLVAVADPVNQPFERAVRSRFDSGSLLKAFQLRTHTSNGSNYNLVTRIINPQAPDALFFRSYMDLYSNQNFVDFLRGSANPSIGSPEVLAEPFGNMFVKKWWRDTDYIASLNNGGIGTSYVINPPFATGESLDAVNDSLNRNSIRLWDEIRNLIEPHYPYAGINLLAPRSINKLANELEVEYLVDKLNRSIETLTDNDLIEMHGGVRKALDNISF